MATSRQRVPVEKGQIASENHVFREFEGINTQAARQAIKTTQFSWLEGVMPIGFGNLKAVQQNDPVMATLTGQIVAYNREFNISNTAYMFYACTSGAAYQVRISDGAVTQIAPNGTFSASAARVAQWKNERVLIIDTTGYYDWNGAALTVLSGVSGMPPSGTAISTFSNRVWIVNGTENRTITYSSANSYNDAAATGGSTTINDETLTSKITQLLTANNFLYVFGADSINIIADVQVVGGVTQFSNTNISANSGTDLPFAIFPYYRAIWYMNESGIFALYGATPRKASDDLDGIFERIDFTKPVTSGTVSLFNILCAAFLFTYNDPMIGARKLMALYFNKKWFLASQDAELTHMATSTGSTDTLYGAGGASVYKLFADDEADIEQTIVSGFWDFADFISVKQSLRVGVEGALPATAGGIDITVDSEQGSQSPENPFASTFEFLWFNSVGAPFSWTNSIGAPFTWLISGYVWLQGGIDNYGHYLGFTLTSSTGSNIYNGFQLEYVRQPAGWGSNE